MRKMPFPFVAPVRGVSFHQDVVRSVSVGTPVEVVAEPENEFDPNACAVRVGGEIVGHLPREIAARLRADGSLCWSAEVVEVLKGSKATGLRIRLLGSQGPVSRACPEISEDTRVVPPADNASNGVVFARSGRRLGLLVEHTAGTVRVHTDDDRIVTYPESLVLLRA